MAKKMGGDLVLQLLHEFRESQQDYQEFKKDMLGFKQDMLGFKQDMLGFKQDMLGFKQDMLGFKQDMLGFQGEMMSFKEVMEVRMDLMQQTTTETLGYLKHIVKLLQTKTTELAGTRQRVDKHEETLDDHELRLTGLEGK